MAMVWIGIMLAALVAEFITMELFGAFAAAGALAGLVANAFGLPTVLQACIAVAVGVVLALLLRPVGMKYINKMRRDNKLQSMVGADAIVISTINNAQGVGMVTINGKQWSAKSHRPNAVIHAGQVVKVVAMNHNTAIVDDRVRNSK